jgi:hypothetical protein
MRNWSKFYEKDSSFSDSDSDDLGIWFSRWIFKDFPNENCIVQYNNSFQIISTFKLKSWK